MNSLTRQRACEHVLRIALVLAATIGIGCTSPGDTKPTAAPAAVKPMDRVRMDIVQVQQKLSRTLDVANDPTGKPQALRESVATTNSAIGELRSTMTQLDQRADEYMAMWSKQATVAITSSGVYRAPNEQPVRSRAKYDQMRASLTAARDEVVPALAAIEGGSNTEAERERLKRGADRLNEALQRLEELRQILNTGG